MAKKETASVGLSVQVGVDHGSVAKTTREINKLAKEYAGVFQGHKALSRMSQANIKQIKSLSDGVDAFGKKLSKAAAGSAKELVGLGKQLENLVDQAAEVEKELKGATDEAKRSDLEDRHRKLAQGISNLNKQIELSSKNHKRFATEFNRQAQASKKFQESLREYAKFGKADQRKGYAGGVTRAFRGDLKGGLKELVSTYHRAGQAKQARAAISKGEAMGGAKGAMHMAAEGEAMAAAARAAGMAAAGFTAAAAGIAAVVQFILAASESQTKLNKALLAGSSIANEYGASVDEYRDSISSLRNAAIGSNVELMKMGMTSEDALSAVSAFAKSSTGSIVKTEAMIKGMGGAGGVGAGLLEFAKNAQLYGKALGMETSQVAGLMGDLVSDVGYNAQSVQGVLGDVVKQASQAGMPVHKFMDAFHGAIPNLDLFTNRIDELTGTVKMLSKAMDPRAVKGFMQAFGQGFDKLDFKQRLKMALVVGPGEMGKIMKKDIGRASTAVREQLPESLREAFDEAMKGGGNVKKMAAVAAQAQAMGVQGSVVGNLNQLARYKQNSQGGVLNQATAMRDMGLLGRLDAMEKYAGKFTGGDLSGLGEHVAKQLGVSESEYKALIDMKAAMGTYTQSVSDVGLTSSKSINEGLKKMLEGEKGQPMTDDEFRKSMIVMAKKDPGKLQDMIKTAATMQIENDSKKAEDDKKQLGTQEDFLKEQVNATTSIADKVKNVIAVLLEKIYGLMDGILSAIGSIYDMLPSWLNKSDKASVKTLQQWSTDARKDLGEANTAGIKFYQQTNKQLIAALESGTSASSMMETNHALTSKLLPKYGEKYSADQEESVRKALYSSGGLSTEDVDKFVSTSNAGNRGDALKMLSDKLSPDQMAKMLSAMAFQQAKGMGGSGKLEFASDAVGSKYKTQKDLADKTGDLDPRAAKAYAAIGKGPAPGDAKDASTAVQDTADATDGVLEATTDVAAAAAKQNELFKKSPISEQGKFQNVLKLSTLDSFRTALMEFAVLTQSDKVAEWQKTFSHLGVNSMAGGMAAVSKATMENNVDKYGIDPGRHFASGGWTGNSAGPAMLHDNEYVVPKGGALVKGGGKSVSIGQVTVNIHTNDPSAVRAEVDKIFNSGG